jgi:hypothetical protein
LTIEQFLGFFIRKTSNHEEIITQDVNPVKRYHLFLQSWDFQREGLDLCNKAKQLRRPFSTTYSGQMALYPPYIVDIYATKPKRHYNKQINRTSKAPFLRESSCVDDLTCV